MSLKLKDKIKILDESLWVYKKLEEPDFQKISAGWTKRYYYLRIFVCINAMLKKIFTLKNNNFKNEFAEEIIYINSINTERVLKFLGSSNSIELNQVDRLKNNSYKYTLKTIITTPLAYLMALKIDLRFYLLYPDFFFSNWGKLESNLTYLHKQTFLKIVYFANDHNVQNRLFMHACKIKKIKTVYLQHAPIAENFPPLKFNYSFLYGNTDYKKYLKIGIDNNANVILSGMPSFDKYFSKRKKTINKPPRTVGVSINLLDDSDLYESVIAELTIDYKVIVRFHPRDKRIKKFNIKGVEINDSMKVTSFDYLSKLDFHIAGDSGIHLESILMNVPSFYLKMSEVPSKDYYKFIENNVIEEIYDIKKICCTAENVYLRAKTYCESVGTEYEGSVEKYILGEINKIKSNR